MIKFKKYKNNYSGESCGKFAGINKCTIAYIIFALILLLGMASCENKKSIDDNFIDTYKNILIVRERFTNDSLTAAKKIDSVMKAHSYTEPQFQADFFKYAQENKEEFVKAIDSLREMAREQYDSLKVIQKELESNDEDAEE